MSGLLEGLINRADHQKGTLGQIVALAVQNHLETAQCLFQRNILALQAGKLLRHVETLGHEILNLSGSVNRLLVIVAEFVHTHDRDDILQLSVSLQNLLHAFGDIVVLLANDRRRQNTACRILANDRRRQNTACRIERIYSRINTLGSDIAGQNRSRVQMRKSRRRRRICKVIGRNINCLYRSDGSLLGRCDPFLKARPFPSRVSADNRRRKAYVQAVPKLPNLPV